MTERYDVHAFKCEGNSYLFIWINNTGVKFVGCWFDSYGEAKAYFLKKADAKRLASQSGYMAPLNDYITIEKVEVFTL
ncbi:hypothetical protein AXM42_18405 [Salmonella enterica subsp. enterica]|nr:hypothetical protein [Salmonella enterica subsp. enterica]EAW1698151.1 hypothetical protein [Salmonella enterica subsp. enterica]EAW1811718.1 hypothetical protein [Salmonella enterica subsp. enterica]